MGFGMGVKGGVGGAWGGGDGWSIVWLVRAAGLWFGIKVLIELVGERVDSLIRVFRRFFFNQSV